MSLPDALNFYISPDTKVLSHFVPLLVNCRPERLVNSSLLCIPVAQIYGTTCVKQQFIFGINQP